MASSRRKVGNIHKDMAPGRSVGGPTQRSTWAAQIGCYGLLKKNKGGRWRGRIKKECGGEGAREEGGARVGGKCGQNTLCAFSKN